MPTYVYECATCGTYETTQSIHDEAHKTCIVDGCTEPVRRLIVNVSIHAYTPVGEEAAKIESRRYRTNKEIATGLAKGTMRPPDDRDVAGDKQPRSSVSQLNGMLDHARKGFDAK